MAHSWVFKKLRPDIEPTIDRRTTIADLNRAVRRYPTYQTLGLINRISAEEGGDSEVAKLFPGPVAKGHKGPVFTQHGLAFVARQSILYSNDYRGAVPTWKDVARLCSIYNNFGQPLTAAAAQDRFAIIQFLIQTAYEQFPLQQNIRNLVPRALYLFELIPSEIRGTRYAIDLDMIFRQLTGLGVREFLNYGFALWGMSTRHQLTWGMFTQYEEKLGFFTQSGLTQFLRYIASSYDDFRMAAGKEEEGLAWKQQAFNSLWQWPIAEPVVKDNGDFIVPIPSLLLHRVTDGIYYDFLNLSLDRDIRDRFLIFFGDIFQAYVGKLLAPYYPSQELLPEHYYGRDRPTVDWIAVEGHTAILFECKAKRFTKASKRVAAKEDLIRDLKLAIVGGAEQLADTKKAILERAPGLERLHHVEQVLPILVVSEPLYLANTPLIRDLVRDELTNAGLKDFEFQIVSVRELEYLIPFRERTSITGLLAAKFQNPDARSWDLGAFLREGPDPGTGHKLLDAALDTFVESMGTADSIGWPRWCS